MDKKKLYDVVKRTDIGKVITVASFVQNTEGTISSPAESVRLVLQRAAKTVTGEKSTSFEVCANAKLVRGGARLGGEKIELKKS